MPFIRTLLLLSLFIVAPTLQAQPQAGDTVSLRGVLQENTYVAGGSIFSSAQIQGDLVASGGNVLMDGSVSGDALLFAGTINLTGAVNGDLRAMGGNIIVNSAIGGDVAIAGGQLTLGNHASVKGRGMLAGGSITVAGDLANGLQAAGGRIVISGHIQGDVDLSAEQIDIQDGAIIDGNLSYRSPQEANIAPGAKIQGRIDYNPGAMEWNRRDEPGNWLFMLTLAIAAVVFYLLFPGYTVGSLDIMRAEFWKSLGFGVVVLVVLPFVALFLMVIVLGVSIGMPLLLLYFVALMIGTMLGMSLVGEQLARWLRWPLSSRGRRVLSILVAFLLMALLQLIPILGALLTFLILLLGLGGGIIVLFRRYTASPTADIV